jgi:hypothetical protein
MKHLAAILTLTTLAAISAPQGHIPEPKPPELQLLMFRDCPNSPQMKANLIAAMKRLGRPPTFKTVDLRTLPKADSRLKFGAPTILRDGKDLFGLQGSLNPGPLSCRVYPGGVPSAKVIASRLKSGPLAGRHS